MLLPRTPATTACALAWLLGGCGDDESPPPIPPPADPIPAVDLGAPPAPDIPPPPADPWTAEGLEPLRNGDDLVWPVEAVHITSEFGWRTDPLEGGARMHAGTDFRGDVGDVVLSVAGGTVTFAGDDPVLGTMVVVDHGLGITSLYAHLSDLLIWPGASVARGGAVGLVGNTGRSAAAHLHLTIKIDDVPVDPMMLLGQPLHRATALRGAAPRTREPVAPAQNPGDDPDAAPVLQP